ncbi:hypothetical protein OCA8868_01592 [Octadecabacter ascidiaceicola]|uniref:SmpA / OmlA family protein n=1 Tax=Octadecabacter ascidiaceicola TaxID=1655543 RepID=A0A238K6Y1_9RHOB|nr:hypothetical protein OCA8868_01592 [Octadecabacter ascidiaceicola]
MLTPVQTIVATLSVLVLSGCQVLVANGSLRSGIRDLTYQMPYEDVVALLGPPTHGGNPTFERFQSSCLSWLYSEIYGPRYLHIVFEEQKLSSARDNFKEPCTERVW